MKIFRTKKLTYKALLKAADNNCDKIKYDSDTKQGFTIKNVSQVWNDRARAAQKLRESYKYFYEAWQLDGVSGKDDFEKAYMKLIDSTIEFRQ